MQISVTKSYLPRFFVGILVLIGLYFASIYNFLLFHSLAEFFSIFIAFTVFSIAWNSKKFSDNHYILFLGIAFAFIGTIDLVHLLAYKDMNVFTNYDANLPTQLWIAARYLQALTLLIAPIFFVRKLKYNKTIFVYSIATVTLLALIFARVFPDAFIEGFGLTDFKIISEYIISTILLASLIFLYKNRNALERGIFKLIAASIILTIFSELAFTFYISVFGFSNLVGHYFKIIAFYLIYVALVKTSLTEPYKTLFKKTKDSEERLKRASAVKDVFIDIASHDLLNPTTSIKLTAELALRSEKNPKKKENLKMIEDCSSNIIKIIRNAKSLAKIETSEELKYKEEDLGKILKTTVDNMRSTATKKNMDIKGVNEGINGGKFIAKVNPLIADAFSNLISNAIKYGSEKSEVTVKIESKGRMWQISVANAGVNIPEKDKKGIFDRFSRLEKNTKIKGTGLGLAITKRIVTAHNGRVLVEDNPGGGSIFIIQIPK